MKETLRRWVTHIKEDKLIRRLLLAAIVLVSIAVAAFVMKGPVAQTRSVNPADHFTHEKPGITNIKSPTVITLCGLPIMMIEPNDNGSTTLFGGKARIKERLKQIPETPIIVTEISKSYQGLSCEALFGIPSEEIEPSSGTPNFPQAVPPGYMWSA